MSNKQFLKFEQAFIYTDTIHVVHNLGIEYLGAIRIVSDGQVRSELIDKVEVPRDNSTNELTITLTEALTGVVQLLSTDYVRIGQASSKEASTSLVFGSDGKQAESSPSSQTTSDSKWLPKVTMAKTFEAGLYRIGLSYIWSMSSIGVNRHFGARLLVDDEEVYRHKEGARTPDSLIPTTFFLNKELTAGEHTLSLEFRREGGKMSVSMKNANIEIWKTVDG